MTGTSSSSSFTRLRRTATTAAALVIAGVGLASAARAADGPREWCGKQPMACATAAMAGAREQGQPGKDHVIRDRDRDRDRRDGKSGCDDDDDDRLGRSGGDGRAGPFDGGRGYGRGHADMRAPRQHEWEETREFMRLYAPRRHAAVDQMPDGDAKQSMKRYWFARYRSLQSLQRRDPAGHEQRLAQLRIEDQIFGIISDWSGPNDDADRRQLRETLKTQVSQLVDLDLMERQRKVESLKRELAEQIELLERDQTKRDALVEERVSRFADWAARWASRRKQNEAEKENQQGGGRAAGQGTR